MPQIVKVLESVLEPAKSSNPQQQILMLSCGGTTLETGESRYIGSSGIIGRYLKPKPAPQTSPTVSFVSKAGINVGDLTATLIATMEKALPEGVYQLTSSDLTDSADNTIPANLIVRTVMIGSVIAVTVNFPTGATFTVNAGDAFTATLTYSVTSESTDLSAADASWFNNTANGYLLVELGAEGMIDTFKDFTTANPDWYAAIWMRGKASVAGMKSLAQQYTGANARRYLSYLERYAQNEAGTAFVNPLYSAEGGNSKGVIMNVEDDAFGSYFPAPYDPTQEHLGAAAIAVWTATVPTSALPNAPMNFRYLAAITPWKDAGNQPKMAIMKAAAVNFAGLAKGGSESTSYFYGTCLNNDPMGAWFGADYIAYTLESRLTLLLQNGQQPGPNELLYDQAGINRIEAAEDTVMAGSQAAHCCGPYTVTCIPYAQYELQNPQDVENEIYNGSTISFNGIRGFKGMTIGLIMDLTANQTNITATIGVAA